MKIDATTASLYTFLPISLDFNPKIFAFNLFELYLVNIINWMNEIFRSDQTREFRGYLVQVRTE